MEQSYGVVFFGSKLSVPYAMVALDFDGKEGRFGFCLDFVVQNIGEAPARLGVMMRGRTEASMERFSLAGDNLANLLGSFYADYSEFPLLSVWPGNAEQVQFHRIVNMVGRDYKKEAATILSPNGTTQDNSRSIPLKPEAIIGHDQTFTSYLIPGPENDVLAPGQMYVCRMRVMLSPASYTRLIAEPNAQNKDYAFVSLCSRNRVLDDICVYDFGGQTGVPVLEGQEPLKNMFTEKYKGGHDSVVLPSYQDWFLLRAQVCRSPGAYGMTPAVIHSETLRETVEVYRHTEDGFLKVQAKKK